MAYALVIFRQDLLTNDFDVNYERVVYKHMDLAWQKVATAVLLLEAMIKDFIMRD